MNASLNGYTLKDSAAIIGSQNSNPIASREASVLVPAYNIADDLIYFQIKIPSVKIISGAQPNSPLCYYQLLGKLLRPLCIVKREDYLVA